MPKGSKRVAARQAALSKKKKRSAPRPAESFEDGRARVAQPLRPRTPTVSDGGVGLDLPEIQAPQTEERPSPSPRVATLQAAGPTATSVRRPLPQLPHLKTDLKTSGVLALGVIAILIILSFFVG